MITLCVYLVIIVVGQGGLGCFPSLPLHNHNYDMIMIVRRLLVTMTKMVALSLTLVLLLDFGSRIYSCSY